MTNMPLSFLSVTIFAFLVMSGFTSAQAAASPNTETTEPALQAATSGLPDSQAAEEDSYRYFKAAVSLYKEGRLQDAVAILRYLHEENPEDKYLAEYLERVTVESARDDRKFEADARNSATTLKKGRVTQLIEEGDRNFLARKYDDALLNFSDALAIDPMNAKAQVRMETLKEVYMKKVKIDSLVRETNSPRKDLTDQDMDSIVRRKRAEKLLAKAETEMRIKQIVSKKRADEERARKITLGPGDVVSIGVEDHPELSGQSIVQAKGRLVLPLVNRPIHAQGLTLDELASEIQKVLENYIRRPSVNVSILEYKSKTFHVIDEVGSESFPITKEELTLRDALFTADWGHNRALGRVTVISPSASEPRIQTVNAYDLIFKGKLQNDIAIKEGDVIYIPLTRMAKTTRTIADTVAPFSAFRSGRDEYLNVKWNRDDWKDLGNMPKNRSEMSGSAQSTSSYNIIRDSDY